MSDVRFVEDCGWWLPADDTHMIEMMRGANRRVDGRLSYQYRKYEVARLYLRSWRRAVDVGAHVGLWSWYLARDFAALTAFEPVERHVECWRLNMADRPHAAIEPFALGHMRGHVDLKCLKPGSSGETSVVPSGQGSERRELKRLDQYRFDDVDLLKIDVEGFELFVLQGAVETLRRCHPVVIAEQHRTAEAFGYTGKETVRSLLEDLGATLRQSIDGDHIFSW